MRSYPFTCLIHQILDIHAIVNIYQKMSVSSNIKVIVLCAYYCSTPKDNSTFIVTKFYAIQGLEIEIYRCVYDLLQFCWKSEVDRSSLLLSCSGTLNLQ